MTLLGEAGHERSRFRRRQSWPGSGFTDCTMAFAGWSSANLRVGVKVLHLFEDELTQRNGFPHAPSAT